METRYGSTGDDTLNGRNSGNTTLYGGDATDTTSAPGNDTFIGRSGREYIYGGSGEDSVNTGTGSDVVYGGSGNDIIRDTRSNSNNIISDLVYGGSGDDDINSGNAADAIFGGTGSDDINAAQGNDLVSDGAGNDIVTLGGGADILISGSGDDNINGSGGTTRIYVQEGWGNDVITADNLAANQLNFDGTVLTDADVQAIGNRGPSGPAADITLNGVTSTGVNLESTGGANGVSVNDGNGNTLTAENFTQFVLTAQDDTALFDDNMAATTIVRMNAGNDTATITGTGAQTDFILDGGSGDDSFVADYANRTDIVIQNSNLATIIDPGFNEFTVENFENFATTDGNDFITVERAPDDPATTDVDESLIPVEIGNISTGANADTVTVNDGVTVGDIDLGSGNDTLTITESGNGVSAGDIVAGTGADNITVTGNVELSSFDMGSGDDRLDLSGFNTAIPPSFINMGADNDTFIGSVGADSVTGGSGDDTLYGGDGDDILYGGDGDDTLFAGRGDATLVGGLGNNTITAGDGDDTVVYTAGEILTLNDFGFQTTGPIDDGVPFNNDFMDLSGFYDDAAAQAAGYNFANQLLAADLADGTIDGKGLSKDGLSTFDTGTFLGGSITFNNTPDTSNFLAIAEQFGVLCFARGTLIETDQGDVPVEELRVGMHVRTKDDGYQPLRWIGSRNVQSAHLEERANLRPIVIRKGALGPNFPERDLTLSQQHRVLLRSDIVERMFDVPEVLVPAKKLLGIKGIEIDESLRSVQYFHMLFDTHQVVRSNGAFSESLYLGPQTRKTLEPEQIDEIQELFPELISSVDQGEPVMQPGRKFVFKDKHVGELVQRTRLNRKHLIKL